MSEKWTDKLPSLMEGYEEAAPEGLWDAVLAGVSPRKRFSPWWYVAGGSLAAAAAVALAAILWKPAAQPSVVPGEALADVVSPIADDPVPQEQDEPETLTPGQPTVQVRKQNKPEQPTEQPAEPVREPKEPETSTEQPSEPAREQNEPKMPAGQPAKPVREQPEPRLHTKTPVRRIEVQVSTGAYLAQAGSVSSGYGVPYNPGMITKAEDGSPSVPMLSRNRPSTTEETHRQSLRLSLGISYVFAPRWSVGTGVTYTVLRSDYATTSGNTTTYSTRHLHYIGIPLQLQFKALEWKQLSLHVNAGPMAEFAVGSKLNTRAYIGDQIVSESQQFPIVKDFRWSIGAGVAAQYRLFRYGALFLQPGFSWHIPNGTNLESYYTLHPCSFDLTFGYRFTF